MTELLWRVSGPTGQAPQNPHSSASSPQALSAGAWGLTQCCSPSQPQSSRGWKKGECVPNWPDLLPTPWPWPSLNPFSLSSLSKSLFLSLPWLALPPSQSVSKYAVTSLNLFPSFIFTFFLSFSFKILGRWWAVEVYRRGAEQSWKRLCKQQNNTVARIALMSAG